MQGNKITSFWRNIDIIHKETSLLEDLVEGLADHFVTVPSLTVVTGVLFFIQACPLNNEINRETRTGCNNLGDFSESFTPAIRSVVDFAKGIPGFILLNQDDQVTLLKVSLQG